MVTNPNSMHAGRLSQLEAQILNEKAKGLSDLEVARVLFVYESTVRSIIRKHAPYHNGNGRVDVSRTEVSRTLD
jgi:hypothetical protein